MLEIIRSRNAFIWAWLPLLFGIAVVPARASAQIERQRTWAVVPLLGFGTVRDNATWGSAGMEAALELEYGGTSWRWNGHGSLQGLGVGCSHACFDGGPAVGIGGSPYGRISLDRSRVRFDVRVELPRRYGLSAYVPLMVGIPISR